MRLGTRQECVGSSPRVSGACQDGAREFAKRRRRLTGRLSGVAEKLTENWEGIGQGLDDTEGAVGSSLGDSSKIGKLSRNTPGDRQRKTVRLAARDSGGCRNWRVRSC
ncbi:hypothetical protein BHM03_00058594 [Ensete ventricosum]|nr:hypothetical protein BHM03_00058594 [Ensete ventricosum]